MSRKINKIEEKLQHIENDESKLSNLIELSSEMSSSDPRRSIKYAEDALKLAEKLNNDKAKAISIKIIGLANYILGDYANASKYFADAIQLFRKLNDRENESDILNGYAIIYRRLGDNEKALKYAQDALRIKREINDEAGIANALKLIGNIYLSMPKVKEAREYYFQAKEIAEKIGNKKMFSGILCNIGICYKMEEKYDEALVYFHDALQIVKDIDNNEYNVILLFENIGDVLVNTGKYFEAIKELKRALKIARKAGISNSVGFLLMDIAVALIKLKKYDEAKDKLTEALEISRNIGAKSLERSVYLTLYELYRDRRRYKSALEYYEKFASVSNDITNENTQKKIAELEIKYKTDMYRVKAEELNYLVKERTRELEDILNKIIETMSKLVETKDPYTAGHQERVMKIAVAIARQMGMDSEKIEGLKNAALLHDIGKIYVPSEILTKPGRISKEEFALIKMHPRLGYELLKLIRFPWPIAEIVFQHHERLDGSGYPRGISGESILLEARIIAVADVVEAISSHRPYRPSLGIGVAISEIEKNRGKLYDKDAVDACIEIFKQGFKLD